MYLEHSVMVVVAGRDPGVIAGGRRHLDARVFLLRHDEQKLGRVVQVRPALDLGQRENRLLQDQEQKIVTKTKFSVPSY